MRVDAGINNFFAVVGHPQRFPGTALVDPVDGRALHVVDGKGGGDEKREKETTVKVVAAHWMHVVQECKDATY